ncbi:DUF6361 family protein [Demequina pelophila]|uniref:DUF6361 family protein n=1 Tax=Demequina pelophila TaxID=1638984 RepID=UPI000785C38F|nr:DUF6361 family protein [Demequina pelophila]
MTSSFGWLDNDDAQRRRMIEIVELFRQPGTVDELGIGSIRDTLANAMFPGTSTLHTRLRYVLFLPWLMQRAATKRTPTEMAAEFRELEFRLIGSLRAGGEDEGVLGNVAGRKLKRLPSVVYWSVLGSWGIVDSSSSDAYFRRQHDMRSLAQRAAAADDPEAREILPTVGLDPHLPVVPSDLLSAATFALSAQEGDYLGDRIVSATEGSLLAWLIRHQPENVSSALDGAGAAAPWEIANLSDLDSVTAQTIEHARRFSLLVHGAALVYNLGLARKARREDVVERHHAALTAWQQEEDPARTVAGWDRGGFWALMADQNPRLRSLTCTFVDAWLDLVATGVDLSTSADAEHLVATRERQIKGPRARFYNQSALDIWPGSSGLGRLTYRWNETRSHLEDLYDAREAA